MCYLRRVCTIVWELAIGTGCGTVLCPQPAQIPDDRPPSRVGMAGQKAVGGQPGISRGLTGTGKVSGTTHNDCLLQTAHAWKACASWYCYVAWVSRSSHRREYVVCVCAKSPMVHYHRLAVPSHRSRIQAQPGPIPLPWPVVTRWNRWQMFSNAKAKPASSVGWKLT